MWFLNAVDEIPIKRMLISWTVVYAALFHFLARFVSVNPLYEPVIPVVAALVLYLLNFRKSSLRRALLLVPAAAISAYFFYPAHPLITAAAMSVLVGTFVFHKSFRLWQCIASAALFTISLFLTGVWQQIPHLYSLLPIWMVPVACGAVFGFCAACSFLPYAISKGPVEEAYSKTEWLNNTDSADLAHRTMEMYYALLPVVKPADGRIKTELDEFTAGILPLCSRLNQMEQELARVKTESLREEAEKLEAKSISASDTAAKVEYERAFANKQRQIKQLEALKQNAERTKARVIHCLTALENMRFAYANREFVSSSESALSIDFFLNMTAAHADNAYETSEAYWKLDEQRA